MEIQSTSEIGGSLPENPERKRSPFLKSFSRFLRHPFILSGGGILLFLFLLALLAPVIAPEGYNEQKLSLRLLPPNGEHWFGTDDFGRDILSRVIYGARISLLIGISSVTGSILVGAFLGLLAGYYGRWVDTLISRMFDMLLAFPAILLAIAIVAILGPSLFNALLAISIVNIPTYGRLMRARVLSLREEEYVQAAKAVGLKERRILFRHILPNSLTPILVQGTMGIGSAVLEAAALGFLGLGAQPPEPEWGKMLADARNYITQAPWLSIFPGLAVMVTVLSFNLLGDGLRDLLDPRMR
ncbi:putative peptide transporter permease subunit: membrane component of ABC superfamily [[Clostridium] ultunense Esp]|nr:putative peptide transporter permease subunit: membrane component of ABC superfamily [[Clostridium] ultunense Esp]